MKTALIRDHGARIYATRRSMRRRRPLVARVMRAFATGFLVGAVVTFHHYGFF